MLTVSVTLTETSFENTGCEVAQSSEETIFASENEVLKVILTYEKALENPEDEDTYQKAFEAMERFDAWDFETQYKQILYKLKKSSSQENFEDIEWIYFNTSGEPDVDTIASSENAISGITEKQSSYQELSYSIENLPEFSSYAVKIVMKSNNPAFVPKIQDMRAVASY